MTFDELVCKYQKIYNQQKRDICIDLMCEVLELAKQVDGKPEVRKVIVEEDDYCTQCQVKEYKTKPKPIKADR